MDLNSKIELSTENIFFWVADSEHVIRFSVRFRRVAQNPLSHLKWAKGSKVGPHKKSDEIFEIKDSPTPHISSCCPIFCVESILPTVRFYAFFISKSN